MEYILKESKDAKLACHCGTRQDVIRRYMETSQIKLFGGSVGGFTDEIWEMLKTK